MTLNCQTSWHTRGPTRPLTTPASTIAPADFRVSGERQFTGPAAATTWPRIRGRFGTIDLTTGEIALPFQHKQRGRGNARTSPAATGREGIRPAAPRCTSWAAQQLVQGPSDQYSKKLLIYCCFTGIKLGIITEGRRRKAVEKLLKEQ